MSDFHPNVLVLGPGGVRGMLQLGALVSLQDNKVLSSVKIYVGVSVGAIVSLALVAGIDLQQLISDSLDIDLFIDLFTINLGTIKENFGLIRNEQIRTLLDKRLREKFGISPTLRGLHLATGKKLVLVTKNLTKDRVEYISCETDPDLLCVDAVCLSMNIPLLFHKAEYNNCVYIDGYFGNPAPVDQFDDGKNQILFLETPDTSPTLIKRGDEDIFEYFSRIVNSSITELKRRIEQKITNNCRKLTLYTVSGQSPTVGCMFDLKVEMLYCGYVLAERFIEKELHDDGFEANENDGISYEDNENDIDHVLLSLKKKERERQIEFDKSDREHTKHKNEVNNTKDKGSIIDNQKSNSNSDLESDSSSTQESSFESDHSDSNREKSHTKRKERKERKNK